MTNRCVDIAVGLMAGSEGKGKLISVLKRPYHALVRTGSVNAAHSVYLGDKKYLFHQLPCGSIHYPEAILVLGANAQIDTEYLRKEVEILREAGCLSRPGGKPRIFVDYHATMVDPVDKIAENGGRMPECGDLYFHPRDCPVHATLGGTCLGCQKLPKDSAWAKLGSTTHGAGANAIRKILRGTRMAVLAGQPLKVATAGVCLDWASNVEVAPLRYATDDEYVKSVATICDTVEVLNTLVDQNDPILLEGTQGALLSLHHGYIGKTTSRDTNAATWCAEAGISPLAIDQIYGVARTYPIRVAGDSGPLSGPEITWDEVTRRAESPTVIEELTSATKRRRRVFEWGMEDMWKALMLNRPTKLMLTFVDYLHYTNVGASQWGGLTSGSRAWIVDKEEKLGVKFDYLSTGPKQDQTIYR